MRGLRNDLLLRLCGLLLIATTVLSAAHLVALRLSEANQATLAVYALGLLAFLAGTSGTALLFAGRHLFDPVSRSDRWVSRDQRR